MSITIRFLRERGDLRWRAIECVLVIIIIIVIIIPGDGLTLFAPTNSAFAKLSSSVTNRLTRDSKLLIGKSLIELFIP